jgi:hypothetical protein
MDVVVRVAIVAIAAVVIVSLLYRNTAKWADLLRQYYIAQSNKTYGNSDGWDEPWRLTLFKALVIFFGLMAILGVYVLVFSQQQ